MKKETQKQGISQAFKNAVFVVAGSYLVLHAVISSLIDDSDEVSKELGLDRNQIEEMVQDRVAVYYPESLAHRVLISTILGSDEYKGRTNQLIDEYKKTGIYDVFAYSIQRSAFGNGSTVDKLTAGLSSKLYPCIVATPSDKLLKSKLFSSFTSMSFNKVENMPGSVKDYRKLILFHELEHCNQNITYSARANETGADKRAADEYLSSGGDREVVRSFLYMRIIGNFRPMIQYGLPENHVKNDDYIMAPMLYGHYFGGEVLSEEESIRGFTEAITKLQKQAGKPYIPLISPDLIYKAACKTLAHEKLSPESRLVLSLYKDAYEYFTTPQDPKPTTKVVPALQV